MAKIDEATLREMVQAGAVQSVRVIGKADRWYVVASVAGRDRHLGSARKEYREWRHLDTLAQWVRDLGLSRFEVDCLDYRPEQRSL